MERSRGRRIARLVLLVLPLMILVFLGLIWAVFSLWNWLMPAIFGLPAVTYGQALGLMLLCWILFGGFRGGRSGGGWRYGMRRRWQRMSPEEREEFIQGLRTRWGGVHPSPPGEQE